MKGYVHIYTGNGKGKSTAAFGLALRAAGHGMRTYIGQFMKGQPYGEIQALQGNPLITIEQFGDESCCIRKEEVLEKHIKQANEGLQRCADAMAGGAFQLVMLDEVCVALWFGLLREEQISACLVSRPEEVEVVLTGRYAPKTLIEMADIVTDMHCRKHYYDQGVLARDGIER